MLEYMESLTGNALYFFLFGLFVSAVAKLLSMRL